MSKKLQLTALAAIVLAAAPISAQTDPDTIPEATLTEMIETGSAQFNSGSCVICHAVGGRGSGAFAPDLSDVEWLHSEGDFDGIFNTIFWEVPQEKIKATTPRRWEMHPRGGMNIDRGQIRAVTAYVWSLSQPGRTELVDQQAEFLQMIARGRVDEALAMFGEQRNRRPEHLLFPERAINSLGYVYLRRDMVQKAIELFKLNVQTHPDSWNTYDSLAEGYAVNGDTQLAIRNYEKSVELNPENESGLEKLRELRGES